MHGRAVVFVPFSTLRFKFVNEGWNIVQSRPEIKASTRSKADCRPLCALSKADNTFDFDIDVTFLDTAFNRVGDLF